MRSWRMTFILRKCYFSFCRGVILVIFQKDHKSGVRWLLLKCEISFYFGLWLIYQSCKQFGLKDKCLQCFLVSWPNMALLELILSDTLKCCSQSWFIIGVGLPLDHWVAVFLVDYNDLIKFSRFSWFSPGGFVFTGGLSATGGLEAGDEHLLPSAKVMFSFSKLKSESVIN